MMGKKEEEGPRVFGIVCVGLCIDFSTCNRDSASPISNCHPIGSFREPFLHLDFYSVSSRNISFGRNGGVSVVISRLYQLPGEGKRQPNSRSLSSSHRNGIRE